MDQKLYERLQKIANQIEVLSRAEESYLNLDASRHAFLASLEAKSVASTEAGKHREALTHPDWLTFITGLVKAEVSYQREKRMLELKFKAYDAEAKTYGIENDGIKRGVER